MKDYFVLGNAAWNVELPHQAFRLFLAGAKAGCVRCQSSLGYFYTMGIGIAQNHDKAFDWYLRAWEQGRDPIAASNLALFFRNAGDLHSAKHYLQLAVECGDLFAFNLLEKLALQSADLKGFEKYLQRLLAQDDGTLPAPLRQQAQRKLQSLARINQAHRPARG